jgi:putative oxidoreductase
MGVDIALLVLRVIVGGTLAGHGTQKLFGWFGGSGLRGTAGGFEKLGYRPGLPMAFLAGLGESGGGALLALGLLTPLAAAAGIGVMLNAIISVHLPKGFWNMKGGFEFPLTIATVFAAIGFSGPGRFSVDRSLGLHTSWQWGVGALALGCFSGITTLMLRARAMRRPSATTD